ncbi:hypothetical protein [Anaeromicropila populeti]|uniref:Uncharacterized protein n=1 Tax=Anaeromicropila populeti TaxID=37658 RepID=A0A1I6IBW9_9FIRM|nr:hypothetical protein [Anaeromicropila populeti]SFR63870.1 hypothetical protein SAMN05661086_00637 [Anaeromicropila populeti]
MQWSEQLEEEQDFFDLIVMEVLNRPKTGASGKINDKLYIREERCIFERKTLCNGKIRLLLPSEIETGQFGGVVEIYPSNFFPEEYVFTNRNSGFVCMLTEQQGNLEESLERWKAAMEETQETIVFYDTKACQLAGRTFGRVTIKGYDREERQCYSYVFITNLGTEQFIGIIGCFADDAAIWENVSEQIMESMEYLK